MAASFCRRSILNLKNFSFYIQKRTGYVVLIPESPHEVADFNTISLECLPDFSHLSTKNCTFILNQYAQQYDLGSWEIHEHLEKQLKESKIVDVFKNVIEPLEVLTVPFLTSWGVTRTLYLANQTVMPIKAFTPLNDRVVQIRNDKYDRETVYSSCKNYLVSEGENCTEEQKRVMKKFIWEGFHNGLGLEKHKKDQLRKHYEVLDAKRKQYELKYLNSMSLFKLVINEEDFRKNVPLDLIRNSSVNRDKPEDGPWLITLQEAVYSRYMEYCNSRDGRRHLWVSYNQIASRYLDSICNATVEVEDIRKRRQNIAECLGFDTYAHLSMETKMAGSVEKVQMVLSELLESAKFGQEKEVFELEKFAYDRNFKESLELWDLPYWKRLEREHRCGFSEEKLKEYFPIGQVLLGLIALCEQLFSIEIQEQMAVDCWAPDVRYFRIMDAKTKSILGGFYFDPYARPDKIPGERDSGWFVPIRPRSKIIASLPLSSLIFSFSPPNDNQPSLLYYREVENLFKKFGQMLQFTLTEANYSEVSGLSNIEWDAVDISSEFLKFWLSEKGTLESISGHYETGEPLPSHTLETLCNIHKHMAGTDLSKEIYFSNLDLYMHLRNENLLSLVKQLWPQHFLFTLHHNDCHPFGFKDVYIHPFAACIYSGVWSKMAAADIFMLFVETGLTNLEDVSALGRKFRSTFLSSGGAVDAAEVFRRFRGRDPDPRSLINLLDLPTAAYFEPTAEPQLSLPETN